MRAAEEAAAALLRTVKDTFAAYGTVSEESSSAYPAGATGYTAVKYLSFVTDQADKAEEIRAALAKTGVTCLDGVRFSCKEDGEYKLEGKSARRGRRAGACGGAMLLPLRARRNKRWKGDLYRHRARRVCKSAARGRARRAEPCPGGRRG